MKDIFEKSFRLYKQSMKDLESKPMEINEASKANKKLLRGIDMNWTEHIESEAE